MARSSKTKTKQVKRTAKKTRPKTVDRQTGKSMAKSKHSSRPKESGGKKACKVVSSAKSKIKSAKVASKVKSKAKSGKIGSSQCASRVIEADDDDARAASCESVISCASSQNVIQKRRKPVTVPKPRPSSPVEQADEPTKEVASQENDDDQSAGDVETAEAANQQEQDAGEEENVSQAARSSSKSRFSTDSNTSTAVALATHNGEQTLVKIPQVVLSDGWVFCEEIGRGAFARVYRVTNETKFPDEAALACKMFNLRAINSSWTRKHLRTELKITRSVQHPNIMSALEVMKTGNHAFIFMRLARNGTILNYMYNKLRRPVPEAPARRWFRGLIRGVHYLHSNDLVHRDLKLDNFLLDDELASAQITDFGFAAKGESTVVSILSSSIQRAVNSEPAVMCESVCGTPEYVAPEVHALPLGKRYDAKPVDMYAMGVSLHEMVNLTKIFNGGPFTIRSATLIKLQTNCDFAYNPRVKLSSKCRAAITVLLNPKPKSRPTASAMLKDSWLNSA